MSKKHSVTLARGDTLARSDTLARRENLVWRNFSTECLQERLGTQYLMLFKQ